MSLEEMVLRDELRREAATSSEIDRLRAAIARRLDDARNLSIHPEARLEQAYQAVFSCAWMALRELGLRAVSARGQHRVVLESLAETLGVEVEDIDFFLELLHLRNRDLYEAIPVSTESAEEATAAAAQLFERMLAWLERRAT